MSVIDYIAFAFFALHALYLLAFAALSLRKMPPPQCRSPCRPWRNVYWRNSDASRNDIRTIL